jgi:type III pantothenate kinase
MDALDAHGRHLGGVILPGLRLFHHCLGSSTDIPPTDTSSTEFGEFATDTAAGIASGAMLATTSAVEAMMTRMRQLGGDVQCLLTGGMAPQVARYLKTPHRLVPHLILQGLSLQAEQQERP